MTLKSASIVLVALLVAAGEAADPARQAILDGYATQAGVAPSAGRGKTFFFATHSGGKPDTASCASCHGQDPRVAGRTRAGKPIEPLAVSVAPSRFTDPAKVEKWFGRNCQTVLARACTAAEKADFIAFMSGQ
jgi:cytochrome c peroxidase